MARGYLLSFQAQAVSVRPTRQGHNTPDSADQEERRLRPREILVHSCHSAIVPPDRRSSSSWPRRGLTCTPRPILRLSTTLLRHGIGTRPLQEGTCVSTGDKHRSKASEGPG